MTTNKANNKRHCYGEKCAGKQTTQKGAWRHTRQCRPPTGRDAFKANEFSLLLAGSLKTGGVLRAGANCPRLKPRSALATPKAIGAHLGALSFVNVHPGAAWLPDRQNCRTNGLPQSGGHKLVNLTKTDVVNFLPSPEDLKTTLQIIRYEVEFIQKNHPGKISQETKK